MIIFIIVFLLLSFLIVGHEFGHFIAAKLFGMKVDEFGFGFPPKIVGKKIGETEYSFNWLPFGGFVRIAGENDQFDEAIRNGIQPKDKSRLFSAFPAWKRGIVIVSGVVMNFFLGFLILVIVFMVGSKGMLVLAEVQKNSPAEKVGLMRGDVLEGFSSQQQFLEYVKNNWGKEITLAVRRGDQKMSIAVTPTVNPPAGQGALGVVPIYVDDQEGENIFWASKDAAIATGRITMETIKGLGSVIYQLASKAQLPSDVAGPVGIVSFAQETAHIGFIFLLNLVSLISINLAVMNLLPFPALDGGRLALIIIEKIKGSPVSQKVELWINGVGFTILIGLMIAVTIHDIAKWF